jgi:hypothetical protein
MCGVVMLNQRELFFVAVFFCCAKSHADTIDQASERASGGRAKKVISWRDVDFLMTSVDINDSTPVK